MEGRMIRYQTFITVADFGNFTKAAEHLSYTQSSVSKMIHSLENEWDITLFSRGSGEKRVRLTAEGERLLPLVRKLFSDYHNLSMEVSDIADLKKGTLRIGTFSSAAINVLPKVIEKYHSLYPNIEFELLLGDYEEIESWLQSGRVDCGFLRFPIKSDFDTFYIFEDEYMAVLPADHPLTAKDKVTPEELISEPIIVLERGQMQREGFHVFSNKGLKPKVLVRTWDDASCITMAERGIGIAIEPGLMVFNTPYNVELRPFENPEIRKIYFVVPDIYSAPRTVNVFVDLLLDNLPNPHSSPAYSHTDKLHKTQ